MSALADITTCAANRHKDGPELTSSECFRISFAEKTLGHWHHVAACQMHPPQTHTLWNALGGNAEDDDRDFAAGDFFPFPVLVVVAVVVAMGVGAGDSITHSN